MPFSWKFSLAEDWIQAYLWGAVLNPAIQRWSSPRAKRFSVWTARVSLPQGFGSTSDSAQNLDELKALECPETIESALWRLGLCGTVEAGDLCASYLQSANPRLVKLAADSIAWIGGLNLSHPQFRLSSKKATEPEASSLPDSRDDDPGANLELTEDAGSSPPTPRQSRNGGARTTRASRVAAAVYSASLLYNCAVKLALESGPLLALSSSALELSIQTEGRDHISTDTFSARQSGNRSDGELDVVCDQQHDVRSG